MGRLKPPALTFRPARPPFKDAWPTAFLGALTLILIPTIIRRPDTQSVIGLTLALILVGGGVWWWFRQRWPGDPHLKVNAQGMSYTRFGRTRGYSWKEI